MKRGALLMFAVSLLVGCSSKSLSRSKAKELITANREFAEPILVNVPVGNFWLDWRTMRGPNSQHPLNTLQDAGILVVKESGQKEGWWNKEYISNLTDHGKDVAKSWTVSREKMPKGLSMGDRCYTIVHQPEACHESNGVLYTVNLGARKVVEVTGLTLVGNGTEAIAEFKFDWQATPNGRLFADRVPKGVRTGQAGLRLYDDGWRAVQMSIGGVF